MLTAAFAALCLEDVARLEVGRNLNTRDGLLERLVPHIIVHWSDCVACRETLMVGKILVASVAATLALPAAGSRAWGGDLQLDAKPWSLARQKHGHSDRLYGPRSHYAAAVQTGVYDSCWRHRVIATRRGRDVVPVWICGNYTTYGSNFDWGYGSSFADRALLYGYQWW